LAIKILAHGCLHERKSAQAKVVSLCDDPPTENVLNFLRAGKK